MPAFAPGDIENVFPSNGSVFVPYAIGRRRKESAALLDDGRVIYCFSNGSDLCQSYADSPEALLRDDSVTDITVIFSGLYLPISTVFRAPNGGLYLAVGWTAGGATFGPNGFTGMYRSPSGLGGDWVHLGTMQDYDWNDVRFGTRNNDDSQMGMPEFLPSGRWVITAPIWVNGFTQQAYGMRQGVYTSDDEGATWVLRLDVGFYLTNGTNGFGQGRNIGNLNGKLYFTATGNVTGNRDHVSTDGGTSWTQYNASGNVGAPQHNWAVSDGESKIYDWNYDGSVYENTDPETIEYGTEIRDYLLSGWPFDGIVQPLSDDVWFVSNWGSVVGPGTGWVVGRVGFGGGAW